MSTVITPTDVPDLVATTLRDLGRLKFQQIAQNLVHYEVFSKWFKKDRMSFDSGIGIQRTLMSKLGSGAAKHTGYLDSDDVTMPDVLTQMTVPWVHAQTSWGLVYQQDILMNSGKELILNVIKPRRADSMIQLVEMLEDKAWSAPASSTDKLSPYGLPYWVVANDTQGFNGGLPSGHSTVAGVNLTDNPNFKNYSFKYTTVSQDDLIKKLRTAHRNCRFVSPIKSDDYSGKSGDRYRIYTDEATISNLEDISAAQNQNLGRDMASQDGLVTFRKHPVIWVPQLDSTTNAPVYMIDHSTFYPVCLRGDYLRESEAKEVAGQHNAFSVFVDLTYNYICVDRRRNCVGTTGA